jgi:hypothetical protein
VSTKLIVRGEPLRESLSGNAMREGEEGVVSFVIGGFLSGKEGLTKLTEKKPSPRAAPILLFSHPKGC